VVLFKWIYFCLSTGIMLYKTAYCFSRHSNSITQKAYIYWCIPWQHYCAVQCYTQTHWSTVVSQVVQPTLNNYQIQRNKVPYFIFFENPGNIFDWTDNENSYKKSECTITDRGPFIYYVVNKIKGYRGSDTYAATA